MKDISVIMGKIDFDFLTRKHNKNIDGLEKVARALGVPLCWVSDFIKYQTARGWKLNGKPIKNIFSIFQGWAISRKKRLKKEGKQIVDPELLNVP